MSSSLVRRAIHSLVVGCLAMALAGSSLTALAQDKNADSQQQKKSNKTGKGSAKDSTEAKPAERSSEADKLSNERMVTRGLHKGGSDKDKSGKQDAGSSNKSDSSAKQESQK